MPRVASFCVDFLKADMQHIYRQVSDLSRWECHIVTRSRENEDLYPWPKKRLRLLPKHPLRGLRRLWYKTVLRQASVPPTWGEVKEFHYHVLRTEADVVHVYFGHVALQWVRALQTCPRPVVVSFHGADVASAQAGDTLSEVFRSAALVLARSEALMGDLEALGCPKSKLRLQRTGVPLDYWAPQSPERQFPGSDGTWRFVQTCRFVPKKGLEDTLMAFARIRAEFPQSHLTLIGDGPEKPALIALAACLGVENAIEWPGFLPPEKIRAVLDQSHAFFHPSVTPADGNREGVPNALLEAMAMGLPILATRHGGIPEAVDHDQAGCLVAEHDAEALAQGALRMMRDEALWRRWSQQAQASVRERFERKSQTAVLEAVYDEAVAVWSQGQGRSSA